MTILNVDVAKTSKHDVTSRDAGILALLSENTLALKG